MSKFVSGFIPFISKAEMEKSMQLTMTGPIFSPNLKTTLRWMRSMNERSDEIMVSSHCICAQHERSSRSDRYHLFPSNVAIWRVRLQFWMNYVRHIFQMSGITETCRIEMIKAHYYFTSSNVELSNKCSIIPRGDNFEELLKEVHNRDSISYCS
jgi:hypothetical protein